jgi:hypothetical protein
MSLQEDYPSNRFDLDSISGLKEEFKKIEALVGPPPASSKTFLIVRIGSPGG